MSGKIILVTGGSRSGKSEFAEQLVRTYGGKCAYIATAQVFDEEMRARVQKHKARRQESFWLNYEVPYLAHERLKKLPAEVTSVLFDCLTIYLTNLLYNPDTEILPIEKKQAKMLDELELLLDAAQSSGKNVVFVTNELGSGLVPFTEGLREFRDLAGQANQIMARNADEAYLVVSGIALDLKKLAVNLQKEGD